ncbi:hypothetical protein D6764_05545 [Candidatus Woesearchaeota archaeon]|nr:MAG: hypothetical protein D6764_05545 [Candidatus Woesearchaeota archaeon]
MTKICGKDFYTPEAKTESMDLFNSTLNLLTPVTHGVSWIVGALKVLLGGMFGLYLLLVFLRWKEYKDLKNIMQEMSRDMKEMHIVMKDLHETFKKQQGKNQKR